MVLSKSIDRLFDSEDILVKSNERLKFKTLSLEESVNVVADCALKYGPSAFRVRGVYRVSENRSTLSFLWRVHDMLLERYLTWSTRKVNKYSSLLDRSA